MMATWKHITIMATYLDSLYGAGPTFPAEIHKIIHKVATQYGLKRHPHNLPWNKCLLNLNHRVATTDDVQAILEWYGNHFHLYRQCKIVNKLMMMIEQKSEWIAKMKDFEDGHFYHPQHDFEYLVN
jgi:hypothetical protein